MGRQDKTTCRGSVTYRYIGFPLLLPWERHFQIEKNRHSTLKQKKEKGNICDEMRRDIIASWTRDNKSIAEYINAQ